MNPITYVPIDSELFSDIKVCCDESGVNVDDVVDYSLRVILENYISKRNKRYSNLSIGELREIYPESTDESLNIIKNLAKDDKLGIIRFDTKEDIGDDSMEYIESNREEKLCESCNKLASQEESNNTLDSTKLIKIDDSPEAVLPMLSQLIDSAHSVNISINVILDK